MFGLLGPNGAGKSTLMRSLATLLRVDSGSVRLGNLDILTQPTEARKILGYLPQEFGLYPRITAYDLLAHLAILKGIANGNQRKEVVQYLLHRTNLYDHRNKRLGTYSGGMKQRFGIAQALLSNPKLLIVDEPTAGLDPIERNRFHNLLSEIGEDTVVILSTHIVDDIKELCSDMAILHQGRLVMHTHPMDAVRKLEHQVYKKIIPKTGLEDHKEHYNVISEKLTLSKVEIHIISESEPGNGFCNVDPDLEDVYFSSIS